MTKMAENLLDANHAIFDRVTRLETQMSALVSSVSQLTDTIGQTNLAIGEIRTIVSGVGKTDGKTIVTIGVSVLGAIGMIGAIFLGPINRDMSWTGKEIYDLHTQLEKHESQPYHFGTGERLSEMKGELRLFEQRLGRMEAEKK